jgi:predicted Zn-ribbon and HTH transcriptional regulator
MKKKNDIPVPGKEDNAAVNKRRENYALSRDLLAQDFNEAIAKRKNLKDKNLVKCEKCGKEFSAELDSEDSSICPECKKLVGRN